ncbi:hypothetical protein S245_030482 [Arachis hypogaea]
MDKQCLDLSFWPPPGMQFIGHKLAVAAYIFANGLQPSEILVEDEHCTGNREALWTLRPGEEVVDDLIINLVVAMVSSNKADKQRWWLPTMFAQIAMSPAHHCKSTLDYIVAKYMGFADNLRKIYVPLHMGRHWYLMIVDMWDQNLIYLDSLKSSNERQARIDQMLEVACLLDVLLSDISAYECKMTVPKCISKFRIHEPHISQQAADSMDCRVWVA